MQEDNIKLRLNIYFCPFLSEGGIKTGSQRERRRERSRDGGVKQTICVSLLSGKCQKSMAHSSSSYSGLKCLVCLEMWAFTAICNKLANNGHQLQLRGAGLLLWIINIVVAFVHSQKHEHQQQTGHKGDYSVQCGKQYTCKRCLQNVNLPSKSVYFNEMIKSCILTTESLHF